MYLLFYCISWWNAECKISQLYCDPVKSSTQFPELSTESRLFNSSRNDAKRVFDLNSCWFNNVSENCMSRHMKLFKCCGIVYDKV